MKRAVIVGGTSCVGRAIARSLEQDDWSVTPVGTRDLDRNDDHALAAAANGFDLIVDVIPFEAAHAEQLLALDVGAIVAISSAAVYADDDGRTLDDAQAVDDFPEFPVPIPETQRTVEPGDEGYAPQKVKLERILVENDRVPATVVRPCAIYGRGDRLAREWFFVKRALDRRPYVVLSNRGLGHFHTTAAENIGELVRLIAAQRRTGIFNCGDPDPPIVLDIARAIGDAAGYSLTEILLPDPRGRGEVGQTPWSTPKPLLVDMKKAEGELGYRPATRWSDAISRQVEWLLEATRDRDWRKVFPRGAEYLNFDYEREDEFVARITRGAWDAE